MHSTGPKTERGKQMASVNSTRHGVLSHRRLLAGEDEAEYTRLHDGFLVELKPVGVVESSLVAQLVECLWCLRRIGRIETEILNSYHHQLRAEKANSEAASHVRDDKLIEMMNDLSGRTVADPLKHSKWLARAKEERDAQFSEDNILGNAFLADSKESNALSKLWRYATSYERRFVRFLHELQRLQAARAGHDVVPPLALDVDLAVSRRDTPAEAGNRVLPAKATLNRRVSRG